MKISSKYYTILLATIGVLLTNQMIIQYYLYQKKFDARTINITGKQRMLSQRINLEIQFLSQSQNIEHSKHKAQLLKLFKEWKENHYAILNGSTSKELKAIHSKEAIQKLNTLCKK